MPEVTQLTTDVCISVQACVRGCKSAKVSHTCPTYPGVCVCVCVGVCVCVKLHQKYHAILETKEVLK
jgi:hypothetical protein